MKAIQSDGGVAVLAHPVWTAWSWRELSLILNASVDGFEVANGYWRRCANGRSDQIWSMALNAGYRPAVEQPGRVIVECSPCRACYFSTAGWAVKNDVIEEGVPLATRFELDLAECGYRILDYLVIVLEDADGNRAWTAALDVKVKVTE